jgi:hypothetical protein
LFPLLIPSFFSSLFYIFILFSFSPLLSFPLTAIQYSRRTSSHRGNRIRAHIL